MSAPSVMDFLRRMASMADAHRREFQLDRFASQDLEDASDDQKALAAVAELVAAVEHDFDTRRRVPLAGPQDLQDATDRVAAALAAMGAPDERP